MATTYAIRPIAPVKRLDGYTFVGEGIASGETFKEGALVLRNGDGDWAECGADPALIAGVALCAVADANPADTFGTVVPTVPVATADQEFRGTLEGTYAAADLGDDFGVVLDATGYWTIDRSDTSNTRVRIVGVEDGVAVGDINVPVRFIFLPANRQVIS